MVFSGAFQFVRKERNMVKTKYMIIIYLVLHPRNLCLNSHVFPVNTYGVVSLVRITLALILFDVFFCCLFRSLFSSSLPVSVIIKAIGWGTSCWITQKGYSDFWQQGCWCSGALQSFTLRCVCVHVSLSCVHIQCTCTLCKQFLVSSCVCIMYMYLVKHCSVLKT